MLLTLALLPACASIAHVGEHHAWQGEALGHMYSGSCAPALQVDGRPVRGLWKWPRTIILDARACLGNELTLRTLANVVTASEAERYLEWQNVSNGTY